MVPSSCRLLLAACAALTLLCGNALAQTYPSKPIRIIVPYTPGGFNDTLGRLLALKFQEAWGQPAVVENKPGAGTVIGTETVAKSAPDGYTLLIVALPFSVLPSLYPNTSFSVTKDFVPIVLAGATQNMLVVNTALPVNSVQDLIALAKRKPDELAYASTGSGSSNHLSMEMFKSMTGTRINHIPYKGTAPAVTDLLGGQVQVMFDNTPNVLPHVKAGKLRALAVTGAQRSSFTPDLPTVAESGVPGYEITVWFGLVAPAGTPKDIVAKLNAEVNRVLALPDTRERFQAAGVEPIGGPPEAFAAHLQREVTKWARVVKESGAKAE
ncbi:MAG: tripartite tricarboxylate transporter substrate binding protein [Pseudomonadota bacterium]|nr:tripartite tricarboxylate transporter substrate binding protein [Pseudomonadota bacterium]